MHRCYTVYKMTLTQLNSLALTQGWQLFETTPWDQMNRVVDFSDRQTPDYKSIHSGTYKAKLH